MNRRKGHIELITANRIFYLCIVLIVVLFLVVGVVGSVTESAITRLTDSDGADSHPVWSPDGTKLAFISHRSGNNDIWVMNADGTELTQLTTAPGLESGPTWSPDGLKIAFTSNRSGSSEIWIMTTDGTEKAQITNDSKVNRWPSWSPDGSRIAYQVGRSKTHIWIMNSDGSGKKQVTTEPMERPHNKYPSWSSDDKRIAFSSRINRTTNIWIINDDGTGLLQRTDKFSKINRRPSWKKNKIAFYSNRSGNMDIWIINDDGTGLLQLTSHPQSDMYPSFNPDATKIVFSSFRSGDSEIYVGDVSSMAAASKKPKIVVLANSIDYGLASDFFGFLRNRGRDIIHANASNFEQYKEEKFIVILGGPDAYEGIGKIVQEVLSEDEENIIRGKGARKKYVKTNIWSQGQRVMVIAGYNRNETKNSEDENKEDVASEAQ